MGGIFLGQEKVWAPKETPSKMKYASGSLEGIISDHTVQVLPLLNALSAMEISTALTCLWFSALCMYAEGGEVDE
jgi:hypothetical protein